MAPVPPAAADLTHHGERRQDEDHDAEPGADHVQQTHAVLGLVQFVGAQQGDRLVDLGRGLAAGHHLVHDVVDGRVERALQRAGQGMGALDHLRSRPCLLQCLSGGRGDGGDIDVVDDALGEPVGVGDLGVHPGRDHGGRRQEEGRQQQ
ncbi:hypothetical protein [Streptomyces sp. NL15-2K]|uniref:hypothetical protein n=1 Tax=Streptomyces sp. NL15-2K TaxID=376149 RepID=UPI000F575E4B|nr:hypothetical protein [Streptomyces sp. NL15-2K]